MFFPSSPLRDFGIGRGRLRGLSTVVLVVFFAENGPAVTHGRTIKGVVPPSLPPLIRRCQSFLARERRGAEEEGGKGAFCGSKLQNDALKGDEGGGGGERVILALLKTKWGMMEEEDERVSVTFVVWHYIAIGLRISV